jgi:mono/diheme cytochrome c family protein
MKPWGTTLLALGLSLTNCQPAMAQDAVERGEYLSKIMDCGGCHTAGALAGKPDPKLYLAGSDIGFEMPGLGVFYPPNLTSDHETGLGSWTEADIVKAVRIGIRPDGRELAPVMPWPAYSALTDADARALAGYLKKLPPVRHQAPLPVGPGQPPPAAYLTMAFPK